MHNDMPKMPEPPVPESSDPTGESTEPDRPARGLLARADRAEIRGEDPEHWRRSVVLRFDRIERLLERVASGLPPLEELGRRTAERGEEQLTHLTDVGGRALKGIEALATDLEATRERTVREVEDVVERHRREGASDLVEQLAAHVKGVVEEAHGRTSQEVEAIRQVVTEATTGVAAGMREVEQAQAQLARNSEELSRAIHAERKDTVEAVRALARASEGALRRATEEVVKALRSETTGVVREFKEEVRRDLEALGATIAESMNGVRESVSGELTGVRESLSGELSGVRESVSGELSTVRGSVAGELSSVRDAVAGDVAGVREAVDRATSSIPSAAEAAEASVREAVERAGGVVRETAESQIARLRQEVTAATERIGSGQSSLDQLVTSLTEQDRRAIDVLSAAIQRIEGLAEVIESLGARRGFRRLVETEEELREQQVRLVEDLKAEGEALAAGIQETQRRMESLEAHVAQQMDHTIESVRADLAQKIPVEQSLADVRDLAQAHRDLDKGTTILREELEVLRKRIESWGVPRSAPRLASNLADVEARVATLEELLGDQVVRLEALIQAGQQQMERMSEGRRGVFRRS
jgi:hypothetical protein